MQTIKEIAEQEIASEDRRAAIDALKVKIRSQSNLAVWLKSLLPFTITWKSKK